MNNKQWKDKSLLIKRIAEILSKEKHLVFQLAVMDYARLYIDEDQTDELYWNISKVLKLSLDKLVDDNIEKAMNYPLN